MKKTILLLAVCASTLLLTQCAEKTNSHKPKQTPEEQVAEIHNKYTADQIAQGKTIYNNKCGTCHELKSPGDFTIKRWNKILPEMTAKAELKSTGADLVRAWTLTNARIN